MNLFGPRVPLVLGATVSAAAFVLLAAAHDQRWEIYLGTTLLGAGIGLAFSAMANQIIQSVRPEQTGVATGMNTIMRTIGGTLSAVIVTSSLAAGARGFRDPERTRRSSPFS